MSVLPFLWVTAPLCGSWRKAAACPESAGLLLGCLDALPASLLKLRLLTACYGEVFDESLADEGRSIIASWDSLSLTPEQQEAVDEFQNVTDNPYPWEYIDE